MQRDAQAKSRKAVRHKSAAKEQDETVYGVENKTQQTSQLQRQHPESTIG